MTIRVAVNEAILLRGTSGSARATIQMTAAMNELPDVVVNGVRPRHARGRFRVLNALADARWDLRGAAAAARSADILLSPCNIGLSSGQQSHLLCVYDVMVWESSHLFDPWFAAYARRLIRYSVARADRVLTLSTHARDFLIDLIPSADVRVLRLPGRRGSPAPTTWSGQVHTVLMVGETAAHKSQITGIEATRRLRVRTGVDVRLRVIGPPGNAEDEVRRALAAADPGARWTSRESGLTDEQVDQAYATSWVLLQPSKDEGYGLPLVEAAQHGLPVLHSGAGGMSEVLREASVDAVCPEAFERRLEALLERREWEHAAETARDEARAFSWEGFREAIHLHLQDLCLAPGRS